MSFQNQHGSIANELRKLGMSVDAATRLASILGNPNQPTRTGPQTQDLTPEALRYVTGQTRKLQLSNLDFFEGDPDFRRPRSANNQEAVRPSPVSSVRTSVAPQATNSSLGVAAGGFTSVKSQGDSVHVGLNLKNTGNLVSADQGGDQLVGKTLRVDAESLEDSGITASLENYGNEMTIRLAVDLKTLANALRQVGVLDEEGDRDFDTTPGPTGTTPCEQGPDRTTVVTGVSCVNGNLVVTTGEIPTVECSD